MNAIPEQRRHPRMEVLNAVMISANGKPDSAMAMALDLSQGGARLGLLEEWRPARGTRLWLSFLFETGGTVPDSGDAGVRQATEAEQVIVLRGLVTRTTVDHLGVEFESAQDERIHYLLEQFATVH